MAYSIIEILQVFVWRNKMIKVLEFIPVNKLAPVGGQFGYLYNLMKGKIDSDVQIDFLSEVKSTTKNIPPLIKGVLKVVYGWKPIIDIYKGNNLSAELFDSYDYVHFHSTLDLYKNRKMLSGCSSKIILTSHCPKPMHKEMYEDRFSKIEQIFLGKLKERCYEAFDEYSFDNADYIVFPCEEAEEPYYNNWEKYCDIKNRNRFKYRYMLSGVQKKNPAIDAQIIRERLQLNNKFVISYVGRHVGAKGYDLLKKYARSLLKGKGIAVVVCGKEEPMTGLKDENWIEIGWTKDADSYVNMSDVFVLPNRETYFDLVLLEVMSIGKIVVASRTGGNKHFEQYNSGIFLYRDETEFIDIIHKIKNMSNSEREILGKKNREIYEKIFNEKAFYLRYIECIHNIYKECESK